METRQRTGLLLRSQESEVRSQNNVSVESSDRSRVWAVTLTAMILPFVASLVYFVWLAGRDIANWIYGVTKFFTLVWPLAVVLGLEKGTWRDLAPSNWKPHFRAIPLGLLAGVVIFAIVTFGFLYTPLGDYVRQHSDGVLLKVEHFRIASPARFLAFAVCICLLHSGLEEYYWRWFVYGRLTSVISNKAAILWSSLAFAGHHYVVLWQYFTPAGAIFFGTCVGLGGALWCGMYNRQKSLLGAWISHLLVDAVIFIIGYRLVFPGT